MAFEIPVAVVGEVDHGGSVGGSLEFKSQHTVIAPGVAGFGLEGAGIILLAVGACAAEHHGIAVDS